MKHWEGVSKELLRELNICIKVKKVRKCKEQITQYMKG